MTCIEFPATLNPETCAKRHLISVNTQDIPDSQYPECARCQRGAEMLATYKDNLKVPEHSRAILREERRQKEMKKGKKRAKNYTSAYSTKYGWG